MYLCVSGIYFVSVYDFRLDFRIVPTVRYVFILFSFFINFPCILFSSPLILSYYK